MFTKTSQKFKLVLTRIL